MNKPFLLSTLFVLWTLGSIAQRNTADKVVGVVGDNLILQSDVEIQYNQYMSQPQPPEHPESIRCQIMDNLLLDKLFLAQAQLDSVVVPGEEVDAELERRIKYFIGTFGSKEALEKYYGKSTLELKDDFREDIQNQLLSDKMKNKIFAGMKVSPVEVKEFFSKIPKDSIPYFNAELELGQIVMFPKINAIQRKYAQEKIEKIRQDIIKGADFSLQAILYSEDPGSATDGGNLGIVERGELVTDFEAAAFKLNEGEMSEVVETPFGFHIIKLDEKRGNKLKLRHILVKPKLVNSDIQFVRHKMDSVLRLLRSDSITFREAVKSFSEDEASKNIGGIMTNPKSGNTTFEKSEIDGTLIFTLDKMKVGEYSDVLAYTVPDKTQEKKEGYRIILLKSESKPHRASLEEDYAKIQSAAKQTKQQKELARWIALKKDNMYIKIDDQFKSCPQLMDKWAKEKHL